MMFEPSTGTMGGGVVEEMIDLFGWRAFRRSGN